MPPVGGEFKGARYGVHAPQEKGHRTAVHQGGHQLPNPPGNLPIHVLPAHAWRSCPPSACMAFMSPQRMYDVHVLPARARAKLHIRTGYSS